MANEEVQADPPALRRCPMCDEEISVAAKVCPHCRRRTLDSDDKARYAWIAVIIVFVICYAGFIAWNNYQDKKASERNVCGLTALMNGTSDEDC